jgi:nitrile hydratase
MKARFRVGDRVCVLELSKAGHVRTPFYIRGKTGKIIQFCGVFLNPEDLSVGKTAGPAVPLYRVSFRQRDLWPEYKRNGADLLTIEVYDHWLAPAAKRPVKPKKGKAHGTR